MIDLTKVATEYLPITRRAMVVYPLFLDDGGLAELRFPSLMTQRDFDRIVAMMRTLVIDDDDR